MVALVATPTHILYRIGRAQGPLQFPPRELTGESRFDDFPERQGYSVLYTGDRRACFYECMADFIPDPALPVTKHRGITTAWLTSRLIASLSIDDPSGRMQWLDLQAPQTHVDFRSRFRSELNECRLRTFDASAAMSECLLLSQSIGRWAYDEGLNGIVYRTRHDVDRECWAVFDRTPIVTIDPGRKITMRDPDFMAVVRAWSLPLPNPFPAEHL